MHYVWTRANTPSYAWSCEDQAQGPREEGVREKNSRGLDEGNAAKIEEQKARKTANGGRGVRHSGCKEPSEPDPRRALETKPDGKCAKMHLIAQRLRGRGRRSKSTRHLAKGVMKQITRGGANKSGRVGGGKTRGRTMILTGDVARKREQVARA